MTMRRQQERPDGSVITEETPVKLSVKEFCALIGAVLFICGSVGFSWLSLKQEVHELKAGVDMANARLGTMEQRMQAEEEGTRKRLDDWNPWRWKVSYDVVALGKKTGTETLTHEEGK